MDGFISPFEQHFVKLNAFIKHNVLIKCYLKGVKNLLFSELSTRD